MATPNKVEEQWKMLVAKLNNSSSEFVDSDWFTITTREIFYKLANKAGYRIETIDNGHFGKIFVCKCHNRRVAVDDINFDNMTSYPCDRYKAHCSVKKDVGHTGRVKMRVWKQ